MTTATPWTPPPPDGPSKSGQGSSKSGQPSGAPPPWADFPIAPQLTACGPIYARLMAALHVVSMDPGVTTIAAIVAITELLGDLIASSGALWVSPDIIPALRTFVADLEQRRQDEAPKPLLPTLREFFASTMPHLPSSAQPLQEGARFDKGSAPAPQRDAPCAN
jgi:hypothetical protein